MTSQLNVTDSNWSSAAGLVDTYNGLINAIKDAHDGDKGAVAAEIGIAAVSTVIDTVSFVFNPLSRLISAGLGWLIEHVQFLKAPLDLVAGNPDGIKAIAESLHKIGQDLRNTAADMDSALQSNITQWVGEASDNFRNQIAGIKSDIDGAGHSVDIAGYVVETTMALVTALRGLLRDIITGTLGDIIATMLVALAAAPFTFGASIPAGVTACVAMGVARAAQMAAKLARMIPFGANVAKRLDDLANAAKKAGSSAFNKYRDIRGLGPVENSGGSVHTNNNGDDIELDSLNTHGSNTGDDAASTHSDSSDGTDIYNATPPPSTHSNSSDGESGPPQLPPVAQEDWSAWGDDTIGAINNAGKNDDAASVHTNPADDAASTHTDPGDDAASTHSDGSDGSDGTDIYNATPPPSTHGDPADDAASTHTNPADDGASTHTTSAADETDSAPASLLKPWSIDSLTKYEDWLKNPNKAGLGADYDRMMFIDKWLKEKAPDAYPYIKGVADLKSSQNVIGIADKLTLNTGKSLTDIQSQAQTAWDEANAEWQKQHPDPAADQTNSSV